MRSGYLTRSVRATIEITLCVLDYLAIVGEHSLLQNFAPNISKVWGMVRTSLARAPEAALFSKLLGHLTMLRQTTWTFQLGVMLAAPFAVFFSFQTYDALCAELQNRFGNFGALVAALWLLVVAPFNAVVFAFAVGTAICMPELAVRRMYARWCQNKAQPAHESKRCESDAELQTMVGWKASPTQDGFRSTAGEVD